MTPSNQGTSKRWSATVFLGSCAVASVPAVGLAWLISGRPPADELTPLVVGWSLAGLNALLAAIVNRHVFRRHREAFLAWALLGNGFRLLLLVVAILQADAFLPAPREPLFLNFLAGYLLFLNIEVFILYNYSRRAGRTQQTSTTDGRA